MTAEDTEDIVLDNASGGKRNLSQFAQTVTEKAILRSVRQLDRRNNGGIIFTRHTWVGCISEDLAERFQ